MSKQFVINYMGDHSGLASHKRMGNNAKQQRKTQLSKLSADIKETCGEDKTPQQIENMWKTSKKNARAYNAAKRTHFLKTGNPTEDQFIVNNEHEQVLAILGSSHNNGLALVKETGIHKQPLHLPQDQESTQYLESSDKRLMLKRSFIPETSVLKPSGSKIKRKNNHRVVYDADQDNTYMSGLQSTKSVEKNDSESSGVLKLINLNLPDQPSVRKMTIANNSNPLNDLLPKYKEILSKNSSLCLPSVSVNADIAKNNVIGSGELLPRIKQQDTDRLTAERSLIVSPVGSLDRRGSLCINTVQRQDVNKPLNVTMNRLKAPVTAVPAPKILPNTTIVSADLHLASKSRASTLAIPNSNQSNIPYRKEYAQYANAWKQKQSNAMATRETMGEYVSSMKSINISLEKIAEAKKEMAEAKKEKNLLLREYYQERIKIEKEKLDKENKNN